MATNRKWILVAGVVVVGALLFTLNDRMLRRAKDSLQHDGLALGTTNYSDSSEMYVLKRFIKRRVLLQDVCANKSLPDFPTARPIRGYRGSNVTVCTVNQTASSAWDRLFRFLIDRDHSKEKPILSYTMHDIKKGYKFPYEDFEIYRAKGAFVKQSVRAMTVRDPYARLWSAYIDQIFLAGFWKSTGSSVIKSLRPGANERSKKCGHDVSFAEFVRYVGQQGHSLVNFDTESHWAPISDICDLCRLRPQYVSTQETFVDDFRFIMDRVGLSGVVSKWLTSDQDELLLQMKIEKWFRQFESNRDCITAAGFFHRVWAALKLEGYLAPEAQISDDFDSVRCNATSVTTLVMKARRKHKMDSKVKEEVVQSTLSKVYGRIPQKDLDALKTLYEYDFKMFGYESNPPQKTSLKILTK